MKKRLGFVSNSSSSSFVILANSKTHEELKKKEDYNIKRGDELNRCTGVYINIKEFVNKLLENEFLELDDLAVELIRLLLEYGEENLVMVMNSDEQMGGDLTFPSRNNPDVLYEFEWH